MARELIRNTMLRHFDNHLLSALDDGALLEPGPGRLAFTTDSYVVQPLFFPGGDIGRLAVCGTVNDLAMMGAQPLALSCALIIEEGFSIKDLDRILGGMKQALDRAGVSVVTGDTKVVEHGAADGLFINTAGVGLVGQAAPTGLETVRAGDCVLVSGPIGDHGVTIMTQRRELGCDAGLESDCAPLNGAVARLLEHAPDTRFLRDPTRGGLAAVLNEIVDGRAFGALLEQERVPVRRQVRAVCELLGLDPLHVACEGRFVAIVPGQSADAALAALTGHELCRDAAIIGRITSDHPGRVAVLTPPGSRRILDVPAGDPLPRIC